MGRRALPKPDVTLDLSNHLVEFDKLPKPISSEQLFGRSAPLEIEIGSGKGLFMQHESTAHPERCFLGIEVSRKYARHAAGRLAKRELDNAKMVSCDGLRLFAELVADTSVNDVHVYFPDPWWKARHKRRRVMVPSFAKDIERVLLPGGHLHFWTDVEEYFQSTMELIAAETTLKGPIEIPERTAEDDMDYHTHFERRTRMASEPVYRAKFERK